MLLQGLFGHQKLYELFYAIHVFSILFMERAYPGKKSSTASLVLSATYPSECMPTFN